MGREISIDHDVLDRYLYFAGLWCLRKQQFPCVNPNRHACVGQVCVYAIVFVCGERMTRGEGVCTCGRVFVCTCVRVFVCMYMCEGVRRLNVVYTVLYVLLIYFISQL